MQKGEYSDRPADAITLFETFDGPDSSYPDGLIVDEGIRQLDQLWEQRSDQPFLLAVGVIRPHLPFGAPKKYLDLYADKTLPAIAHPEKPTGTSTWHRSGEFFKYQRGGNDPRTDPVFALKARKHYAACVSYADSNVGKILDRLKELDPDNETIVVLWGDHGFHLGEHAIWGKHCLFEESLRSPLIIRSPNSKISNAKTSSAKTFIQKSNSIVESVDIFPTLCALTGIETPADLAGQSLLSTLSDPASMGRPAISYRGNMATIRTATHRLIAHPDGANELYDHTVDPGEAVNMAGSQKELVDELRSQLNSRVKMTE
jgi:iduronate 2-sulfatase